MSELFIGLMSGTSLDGIDGVLAEFSSPMPRLIAHSHYSFEPTLREELLELNQSGADELRRSAQGANALAHAYAACVKALLNAASLPSGAITAIGAHGQTVRHQPAAGYTIQLISGALLAELTTIDVVCDFRSRDVAAGGHGAPLVPAFHRDVFASRHVHRAIINLGGIANITDLPTDGAIFGFDCGPGNLLLDAWIQRHLDRPFDCNGDWARKGTLLPGLLSRLREHEFFRCVPPKSAGRETFPLQWLESLLPKNAAPADVQTTLVALTSSEIASAIDTFCAGAREIYICGGGARNTALVEALGQRMENRKVAVTDLLGMNAEHVEAFAFAWLARRRLRGEPGNQPAVTGALGPRVLGAIYSK